VFCDQLRRFRNAALSSLCSLHWRRKRNAWSDFVEHVNKSTVRYVNSDVICGNDTVCGWTADEINKRNK